VEKVILGLLLSMSLVTAQGRPAQPEQALAREILSTVESEAASTSPDVRAYVWMRYATGLTDQDQQRKLLQGAFLATLEITVEHDDTRGPLQNEILRAMVEHIPPAAMEEMIPRAEGYSRFMMRELLVRRFAEDRNFDRALTLLQGAPDQRMYPYQAALFLMDKLPPARAASRRTILAQAVEIASRSEYYSEVEPMLVKYWRDLPRDQVLTVIARIFERARLQDACPILRPTNAYSYYVDQFLPVLQDLDPAQAEQLSHAREQARAGGGYPRDKCDYNKFFGRNSTASSDKKPESTPTPAPVRHHADPDKPRLVFGCDMGFCREQKIEYVLGQISEHLKRDEIEAAKRAIVHGYSMAEEEWRYDTYADDPNLWTKNMWPSTENWEAFTVLASFISPQYALNLTRQIPDPGIRLITREMLALYWQGKDPDLRPPNIVNREGSACECVHHYMYIPRHWGEKLPYKAHHRKG
jgi:hypothetical protein